MGARLIEERERLGLSQVAFFRACGISKAQQYNFEKGLNYPGGAYLIKADSLGVDILYVLTGRSGKPLPPNSAHASKGSVAVAGTNNTVTVTTLPKRRKK